MFSKQTGKRHWSGDTTGDSQQLKGQRKLESNFVSRLDNIGGQIPSKAETNKEFFFFFTNKEFKNENSSESAEEIKTWCKVSDLNTSMLASLFLSFFLLLPSSLPLPSFLSPSCPLLFLLLDPFLFVKTGSHFVGQISLKLWILLTQHPRC